MSLPPVQPGPGPPAGGGRNIKAAKGRELSPSFVEKGRTGIAMTNWKWVFSWETHIQTPLANQVSTGFYSFEAQRLVPLPVHSPGSAPRRPGWKGWRCWHVHLKLEKFKCSQWPNYLSFHLTTIQSIARKYGKRKKRCIIINKWMKLFAIYYLSPQYWQALVIHEI